MYHLLISLIANHLFSIASCRQIEKDVRIFKLIKDIESYSTLKAYCETILMTLR